MPDMSGVDMVREIRLQPQYRHMGLVVMSQCEAHEVERQVGGLNVSRVLAKPVAFKQMHYVLSEILSTQMRGTLRRSA